MTTKRELVAERLAAIGERFGPAVQLAATIAGTDGALDGNSLYHGPLATPADALEAADFMATYGNFPAGMEPCFAAGLNGDQVIADHCIFDEFDECRCAEREGFVPRRECTAHTEAEHYPNGDTR